MFAWLNGDEDNDRQQYAMTGKYTFEDIIYGRCSVERASGFEMYRALYRTVHIIQCFPSSD